MSALATALQDYRKDARSLAEKAYKLLVKKIIKLELMLG